MVPWETCSQFRDCKHKIIDFLVHQLVSFVVCIQTHSAVAEMSRAPISSDHETSQNRWIPG